MPPRFGLLSYASVANLGDAIQSLAARRFLPFVDCHVPRERLSEEPSFDGRVHLICNGWFMDNPSHWPPHPSINPLLISMHFAETDFRRFQFLRPRPIDRLLAGAGLEYLRANGPVGARDLFTLEQLESRGVPAYHSGCLTLTLQRPHSAARSEEIVACDLPQDLLAALERKVRRPVVTVSHTGRQARSPQQQEQAALEILQTYARAHAVVTTRIHCALPCLAMGTPVLLVEKGGFGRRVSDMSQLLHTCQSHAFLRGRYAFDFETPPDNPQRHIGLAQALEARCRQFVDQAMSGQSTT